MSDTRQQGAEEPQAVKNLRLKLDNIRQLCLAVRILEAHDELQQLERGCVTLAQKADAKMQAAVNDFVDDVKRDPCISRLRFMHARIAKNLKLANFIPHNMGSDDQRWGKYAQSMPDFHPDCHVEFIARFLEEGEKNPEINPTQFVMVLKVRNLPITLARNVTVYSQMDLYKAEWEAKTKSMEGWPGGAERFHSCIFRKVSAAPLPFTPDIETPAIRDFSVCKSSPIPGMGAGVLVSSSPVDTIDKTEGWAIPPPLPGAPRTSTYGLDYLVHGDHDNTCTLMFVLTLDLPIPQWMIPLGIGVKILGAKVQGILKGIKTGCYDKWDATGLEARLANMPAFMDSIRALRSKL